MKIDSLAELFRLVHEAQLRDIHTVMPGIVETYDSDTEIATVRAGIKHVVAAEDGSIEYEEYDVIPDVRILFLGGGGRSIKVHLAKGDPVLLLVSEADSSQWQNTGQVSAPDLLSRFDFSHCWGIPTECRNQVAQPIIEVKADGTVWIGGGAAFTAIADRVESLVSQLATAILTAVPAPPDGGAAIQTLAKNALMALGWTNGGLTPPQGSTASSNLKADT